MASSETKDLQFDNIVDQPFTDSVKILVSKSHFFAQYTHRYNGSFRTYSVCPYDQYFRQKWLLKMPPAIAPRALFGENRLSQIPRGIFFFFFFFWGGRPIPATQIKSKSQIAIFSFFWAGCKCTIVNGRTCTSCEEAYMGAFKTAWALGFNPQRGITYSIET